MKAEKIPEILSACNAGFISFKDMPIWRMTIPAKLQSYMACGKAIIASAAGETERIIREADCGICCAMGDEESLAEGIRQLMASDVDKLGRNAKEYCTQHFSKSVLMDEMDEYIRGAFL